MRLTDRKVVHRLTIMRPVGQDPLTTMDRLFAWNPEQMVTDKPVNRFGYYHGRDV